MEDKKIFLLVIADEGRRKWLETQLARHVTDPTIFEARDGIMGLSKLKNVPPHVLICDTELPKLSGLKMLDQVLLQKELNSTAFLLCGPPPEEERHLDELVTGRVQYLLNQTDENLFVISLMRALNYSSQLQNAEFHLRFLLAAEVLFKEGEKADFVYFVKKGQLRATKMAASGPVPLGMIEVGEFVGEMAYLSGEGRSAQVSAVTDCELIEVAVGHFESVLFKRPSWSKALMLTLSKRVKAANEIKIKVST